MTPRRRLAATALAGTVLLGLTGCERPAPIVTVVSGGNSEFTEAVSWCFSGEGQSEEQGNCAQRAEEEPAVEVSPGQQVGVDVDRKVVERGWFVELSDPAENGEPQQGPVQEGHYFAFTAPNLGQTGELLLVVRAIGEERDPSVTSGEWRFRLVERSRGRE
jgi:hypothetical protein